MMKRFIRAGILLATISFAGISAADYCNGVYYCTVDSRGYTTACDYDPDNCGAYYVPAQVYFSLPFDAGSGGYFHDHRYGEYRDGMHHHKNMSNGPGAHRR